MVMPPFRVLSVSSAGPDLHLEAQRPAAVPVAIRRPRSPLPRLMMRTRHHAPGFGVAVGNSTTLARTTRHRGPSRARGCRHFVRR
jgi:hypothetical protein